MSISSRSNSDLSITQHPKKTNFAWRKNSFNQYNLVFLAAALLPVFSIGLFNIAIDPYGVFNTPTFLGVNQSKPDKWKHQRLFKAVDVTRVKPVTLFLGTSRINLGLDPSHPALKNYQPAYNLGLNAANPYETLRYLQHTLKNQKKIKLIMLSVDFIMFNSSLNNQPGFSEARLEKQTMILQDTINATFSLDTFALSRQALIANINNLPQDVYEPNGLMRLQSFDKNKLTSRFRMSINNYFKHHINYQLSYKYLADIQAIVNLCKQHGILLKVFISPYHVTENEAIRTTKNWSILEEWKRKLVEITPVWDFSGYNSITTEQLSNDMKYYTDHSHYTKEIGDLVLNRLLSYQQETVRDDFGLLLTPANIESQLDKIRANREVWVKNNPELVKLIQDIKKEQDIKNKLKAKNNSE